MRESYGYESHGSGLLAPESYERDDRDEIENIEDIKGEHACDEMREGLR